MNLRLRHIILIVLATTACAVAPARAQFVHFNMSVEPELSADVMQELDFGTVVVNSGINTVDPGSAHMGIFQIRSLNNQDLLVTLNTPEYLVHSAADKTDRIPIHLQASYTNNGSRDFRLSQPFFGNSAWFSIGNSTSEDEQNRWETAYIYMYGSIEIGPVSEGKYSGILVLNVEYY